jgi:hypothetical protein
MTSAMGGLLQARYTDYRLHKLIKSIRQASQSGDQERTNELAIEYGAIIAARLESDVLKFLRRDASGAYAGIEVRLG